MKSIIIFILTVLMVVGLLYALYLYNDNKAREERTESIIGTYRLDTVKTDLRNYKGSKKLIAKNLILRFTKDSFYFSMKVSFIYDSIGSWKAGGVGVEDWNYLYYNDNPIIHTQFGRLSETDSTIYFNSVTPQKNQKPIYVICFKKVSNGF